ncbi:hypothetical protein SAMN05518672_102416 [Chitinophaga sp. CF118]|uniref:hypothetical protein n=1 Tax=Chitinophaga sp. CF118 TaxID=1884367 RepID=UPI0008EAC52D|nr:hypothetical protein [Chitinophaga sp. CF118]SFD55807.1 hypothetical protein SAMN05518672_102416 [Chitinophaga sp. CF118]
MKKDLLEESYPGSGVTEAGTIIDRNIIIKDYSNDPSFIAMMARARENIKTIPKHLLHPNKKKKPS